MGGSAMNSGMGTAALGYYGEDVGAPRRPGGLTAVAVVGIVLAGVMLMAQGMVPWGDFARQMSGKPVDSSGYYGYRSGSRSAEGPAAAEVVTMVALLGLNAFSIMMAVGASGVLCLKPGARLMMKISVLGWLFYSAVGLILLACAAVGPRNTWRGEGVLGVTIVSVFWAGVTLVYPLLALRTLNSAATKRAVGIDDGLRASWRDDSGPLAPTPAIKVICLIMLIVAGFGALSSATSLVSLLGPGSGPSSFISSSLPVVSSAKWTMTASAILTFSMATMLMVGAIMVLRGSAGGGKLIITYAIAGTVLSVSNWSQWFRPDRLFEPGANGITMVNAWVSMASARLSTVTWGGVLIAVFGLMRAGTGATRVMEAMPVAGGATAPEYSID